MGQKKNIPLVWSLVEPSPSPTCRTIRTFFSQMPFTFLRFYKQKPLQATRTIGEKFEFHIDLNDDCLPPKKERHAAASGSKIKQKMNCDATLGENERNVVEVGRRIDKSRGKLQFKG